MPPKNKKLNIQHQMEIRRDAITSDKLHPTEYIEFFSPDGSAKLWYNISTLIRIGETKGHLMQPPHFRDKMNGDLVLKCEEKLGRVIVISPPKAAGAPTVGGGGGSDMDELTRDALNGIDLGDIDRVYQQNSLGDVVERFSHVHKRECYCCPCCFLHIISAFNLRPANSGVASTSTSADYAPRLMCPLDVLQHVNQETQIKNIVFFKATTWRRHVKKHHGCLEQAGEADNYKLRTMINAHVAQLNREAFEAERYHKGQQSTNKYWNREAGWNKYRYNQLVERVIFLNDHLAPGDDDLAENCAFSNVTVNFDFTGEKEVEVGQGAGGEDESDVVEEEEEDEDSEAELAEIAKIYEKQTKDAKKRKVQRRKGGGGGGASSSSSCSSVSDDSSDLSSDSTSTGDFGTTSSSNDDDIPVRRATGNKKNRVSATDLLMQGARRAAGNRSALTTYEQRFLHRGAQMEDDDHDADGLRDPDEMYQPTVAEMAARSRRQRHVKEETGGEGKKKKNDISSKHMRRKRSRDSLTNVSLPSSLQPSSNGGSSSSSSLSSSSPSSSEEISSDSSDTHSDACSSVIIVQSPTPLVGTVPAPAAATAAITSTPPVERNSQRVKEERGGGGSSSGRKKHHYLHNGSGRKTGYEGKEGEDWAWCENGDDDEVPGMSQPDFMAETEGRLSTAVAAKKAVASTKKATVALVSGGSSASKKKEKNLSGGGDHDDDDDLMKVLLGEGASDGTERSSPKPQMAAATVVVPMVNLLLDDDDE